MKKRVIPLFLSIIPIASCVVTSNDGISNAGTPTISTEKYYGLSNGQIIFYDDGTSDSIIFKNGIMTTTVYGYSDGGLRQKEYEQHAYFITDSSNNILIGNYSGWYTVYEFQTKSDCSKSDDMTKFEEPGKVADAYTFWGEYGDGWVLYYGYYRNAFYVTESYAKRHGIIINHCSFDESKGSYIGESQYSTYPLKTLWS